MRDTEVTRTCSSCGDPTPDPFILNGIVLCSACVSELPIAGNQQGFRQPRVDRRRLRREDKLRTW